MLVCRSCNAPKEPISRIGLNQADFVCRDCRCMDCHIVLNFECECGEHHAEPSKEDPQVCVECIQIRKYIEVLAPELLELRNEDFVDEPIC